MLTLLQFLHNKVIVLGVVCIVRGKEIGRRLARYRFVVATHCVCVPLAPALGGDRKERARKSLSRFSAQRVLPFFLQTLRRENSSFLEPAPFASFSVEAIRKSNCAFFLPRACCMQWVLAAFGHDRNMRGFLFWVPFPIFVLVILYRWAQVAGPILVSALVLRLLLSQFVL